MKNQPCDEPIGALVALFSTGALDGLEFEEGTLRRYRAAAATELHGFPLPSPCIDSPSEGYELALMKPSLQWLPLSLWLLVVSTNVIVYGEIKRKRKRKRGSEKDHKKF